MCSINVSKIKFKIYTYIKRIKFKIYTYKKEIMFRRWGPKVDPLLTI